MTGRERVIKALTWDNPNSIVVEGGYSPATWQRYREKLEPFAARIPNDFGFYNGHRGDYDVMPPGYSQDEIYTDTWGCVWNCRVAGMQGIIEHSPLEESLDLLDSFRFPDPNATCDLNPWDREAFEAEIKRKSAAGQFITAGGERLWERVHFLRGYENAMVDMALGEEKIRTLINRIADYNIACIQKYLAYDEVDCIVFGDDWGEQDRLMIHPDMWREYFYDAYHRMFQAVKDAGRYVYFHTDGYLLPIIGDLVKAGADIINLQSGCLTLDELYEACHNKVTVSVDLNRQTVMPYGTPEEMKQHVRDIYKKMEGDKGGLWIKMDVYPDVPLENIQAMCEVFEELR